MMKLYSATNSPYARKVRVVLLERAIAHEEILVNLENPDENFLQLNPNRRVPALTAGKVQLFESNLILEYLLKNTSPASGGEKPALGTALTRMRQHWEDMCVLLTIETMLDSGLNLFQLKKNGVEPSQASYLEAEAQRIQAGLDWLEARCTPEGFVPGEFSILDLNLVCALGWADHRQPFPWRGRANLEQVVARYENRPSLVATRPG